MAGNDTNTAVLLHFDGTNGATTYPDSAIGTGAPHTMTTHGSAALDTGTKKFGSASARIATADGNLTAYISAASASEFNPGSADFTVDFQLNCNSIADDAPNGYMLYSKWAFGGNQMGHRLRHLSGSYGFDWTTDGSTVKTATWAVALTTATQKHIELVRSGTNIDLYIDGTKQTRGGTNIGTDTIFASTAVLAIGGIQDATWGSVNGWFDEFRFSNTARHTSNFTAPTAAYAADYSLTSAVGAFTLTGIAALFQKGPRLVAAAGSYALTGIAALLRSARTLTAVKGTYVLTGLAAIVTHARTLTAVKGAYILTGIAAILRKGLTLTAVKGTYTLTGVAAILKKALFLTAVKGTYVLTGVAAILKKALRFTMGTGTYILTGIALFVTHIVAPAAKFKRRLTDYQLEKRRTAQPTLED